MVGFGIVILGVDVDAVYRLVPDVVRVIEAVLCFVLLSFKLQEQLFFFALCHGVFWV